MPRKKRNSTLDLPALELECMTALWALNQATVEEIRARLLPERPLAYTTVMTVMDRLARKGAAERRKRGRAHVYSATVTYESVRERAIERLVDDFFSGSREQLRAHLGVKPGPDGIAPGPFEPESRPHAAPTAVKPKKGSARSAEGIDASLL